MNLDNILTITGKPGLYEFQGKTKSGFVIKNIESSKHSSISMQHNVSVLGEIAIYTLDSEIPLPEVFKKIYNKENQGLSIDHKSDAKILKSYFKEIIPNYDQDRVYVSDMKKIINWYNILQKNNLINDAVSDIKSNTSEEE